MNAFDSEFIMTMQYFIFNYICNPLKICPGWP